MKIKDNFVFQEIAGDYLIVPVAEEANRLNGVVKLNETGAFLWKLLSQKNQSEEELAKALKDTFNIDDETSKEDVKVFLEIINEFGCLE